jgi:hypothetical protein
MEALVVIGVLLFICCLIFLIYSTTKKKKGTVIWGLGTGVGLILIFFGAGAFSGTSTPQTTTQTAALTVNATELNADYHNNGVSADLQYKNKTINVVGVIVKISNDMSGNPTVDLAGGQGSAYGINVIECSFDSSQADIVAKLTLGQNVTIQGECTGYDDIDVSITNCLLLPPTVTTTATATVVTTVIAAPPSTTPITTTTQTTTSTLPKTLTSIAISPTNPPNLKLGFTQIFTATGTYSDGSTADVSSIVKWSSSDSTIGAFTQPSGGLLTVMTTGTVSITATYQGMTTNSVSITVIPVPF